MNPTLTQEQVLSHLALGNGYRPNAYLLNSLHKPLIREPGYEATTIL